MRCSTHCPPESGYAGVAVVAVVAVAGVSSVAALIEEALVWLLVAAAVGCAAGTVAVVHVLRRDRGIVTTGAEMAALVPPSRRAVPARQRAAISAARRDALIGVVINDRDAQTQEIPRRKPEIAARRRKWADDA
jgi:hypothetical protein